MQAVDAFRAAGGKGMNVTAPFKLDAFAYATDLAPGAQIAGAVNAMKFEGDRVYAQNFDGVGLVRDVVHNLACPLKGRRVLLLGAGGATRGALLPFLAEQPRQLVIANRTESKARELAAIAEEKPEEDVRLVQGVFLAIDPATGRRPYPNFSNIDIKNNLSNSSMQALRVGSANGRPSTISRTA